MQFDQYAAITLKWFKIVYKLLLFTNREPHTGFQLVPESMTLNDLERLNGRHFALFHTIRQLSEPTVSNS